MSAHILENDLSLSSEPQCPHALGIRLPLPPQLLQRGALAPQLSAPGVQMHGGFSGPLVVPARRSHRDAGRTDANTRARAPSIEPSEVPYLIQAFIRGDVALRSKVVSLDHDVL